MATMVASQVWFFANASVNAKVKLEMINNDVAKYKNAIDRWIRTALFFELKVGGANKPIFPFDNSFCHLTKVQLLILKDLLCQKFFQADWL